MIELVFLEFALTTYLAVLQMDFYSRKNLASTLTELQDINTY